MLDAEGHMQRPSAESSAAGLLRGGGVTSALEVPALMTASVGDIIATEGTAEAAGQPNSQNSLFLADIAPGELDQGQQGSYESLSREWDQPARGSAEEVESHSMDVESARGPGGLNTDGAPPPIAPVTHLGQAGVPSTPAPPIAPGMGGSNGQGLVGSGLGAGGGAFGTPPTALVTSSRQDGATLVPPTPTLAPITLFVQDDVPSMSAPPDIGNANLGHGIEFSHSRTIEPTEGREIKVVRHCDFLVRALADNVKRKHIKWVRNRLGLQREDGVDAGSAPELSGNGNGGNYRPDIRVWPVHGRVRSSTLIVEVKSLEDEPVALKQVGRYMVNLYLESGGISLSDLYALREDSFGKDVRALYPRHICVYVPDARPLSVSQFMEMKLIYQSVYEVSVDFFRYYRE